MSGFYDEIASYYDEMIPFDERVAALRKALAKIVKQEKIKIALDAGSATGAACIALAQLGAKPYGLEYSRQMVNQARRNARGKKLKIIYKAGDLMAIHNSYQGKFDGIFCLANTISHFLDKRSLRRVMQNFWRWLKPSGFLLIQLLNYKRMMKEKKRIIKIYRTDRHTFVRFYDFGGRRINFNLLAIPVRPHREQATLCSIPIRGWTLAELREVMQATGFAALHCWSDFEGNRFSSLSSHDLIITCRKSKI